MSSPNAKPLSPNPKSPFLSGNLQLYQIHPQVVTPLGKTKTRSRMDSITFARHVLIGCGLMGFIFGISSLAGSEDLDQPPHRALAELHHTHIQQHELHLRGNEALVEETTPQPGNYIPVSCPGVLEQMRTGTLAVKDPNNGILHGRQVERDPKFWISLHTKEFDKTRWDVMVSGDYYKRSLSVAFVEILQDTAPGARVLDVGGNIGYFTLLSASKGPVIVDAFEPNAKNRLRFCESLNLNQWNSEFDVSIIKTPAAEQSKVNLYPFGVGREDGMFTFQENSNPGQGKFGKKAEDGEEGFQVVTLDGLAKKRNWFESRPDIALLKIAVEGLEYNVILGALELLQARMIRNILMEVSARNSEEMELNKPALDLLIEAGYKLHKVGGWRGPDKDLELDPNKDAAEQIMEKTLGEKARQLNLWWTL
ncbi:Inherit from COG: Methyltransferase [Seminavis robusta]|uniref:Inherit from COG: Methyltransferase n=1 Tax=Seminavis robusta TaxID=568900 RepID=A0A9N8HJE3_9STRA|nr:Inherit from COG: Methyltransferase [Seminavis robusta]|eukprot:Sro854_g211270.1 Inherit from COG: Methyltransferase (422) ;mRNA; r:34645-35987